MNITGAEQSAGFMPVSQSKQDSHEQNIQKQIMTLQEKMRGITYNNEMSPEEKDSQKKALQEKIQDLNNELRQYQLRKRQEEAEKRKEEASGKQQEKAVAAPGNESSDTGEETAAEEEETVLFPESNPARAILSNSNTKEHLASLQKVRNDLEGKLRTASSEEEKARLRKRISKVSKGMGVNIQTIKDTLADGQKKEAPQKDASKPSKERKEDPAFPGRVIITRKRD